MGTLNRTLEEPWKGVGSSRLAPLALLRHSSDLRHYSRRDNPSHLDNMLSDIIGNLKCPSQHLSRRGSPNQCLRRVAALVTQRWAASDNNNLEQRGQGEPGAPSVDTSTTTYNEPWSCSSPGVGYRISYLGRHRNFRVGTELVLLRLSPDETLYVS